MPAQNLTNFNLSLLNKTAVWDFATMGVTTTDTFPGFALPIGVTPLKAVVEIVTPPTSAASTATIAIALTGTPGHTIKAATVITDPFYAKKGKKVVALSAVISGIETLNFAFAVQNVTAGKIKVTVYYTV